MQLIVVVAGHQQLVVNVENNDSAHTIKKGVEKVFGLPANHQILRHSGKQVGNIVIMHIEFELMLIYHLIDCIGRNIA